MVALDPTKLTKDIFHVVESLTGIVPEASDATLDPGTTVRISMVMVIGDWHFEVRLYCPEGLALSLSSKMFMMEPDEMSPADIEDAMGEIINVTAGRVQAYLPGNSDLTTPEHTPSTAITPTLDEGDKPIAIQGACDGHPVLITIHRRES